MEIYILRDSNFQILGICDKKHLEKFIKKFPYGIHYNETNDIIKFKLNDFNFEEHFIDEE